MKKVEVLLSDAAIQELLNWAREELLNAYLRGDKVSQADAPKRIEYVFSACNVSTSQL